MGDKVIINNIPSITISSYSVGQSLNYEVPTPSTVELAIDSAKYFGVNVSDVLEMQAKPNLMDMFTTDAAMQLKIAIDSNCWFDTVTPAGVYTTNMAPGNYGATAGKLSGQYSLGTDITPVALTAANVLQTITAMSGVLDEQNVPETDRWLVLTPYDRQILMQSNLAQAQFMGDSTSIVRNGKIGAIDRFTVYVSNLLPSGAATKKWVSGDATQGGTAGSSEAKRHMLIAGHSSALTFASQVNKVESLQNPTDFGQLVRGLAVYGKAVVKNAALSVAVVA